MAPNARLHKSLNIWSARIVPLIICGLVAYATWIVVDLISVKYLLDSNSSAQPQTGAAIAIIVVYFLLLTPFLLAFLRVVQVVITNPGIVPINVYDPLLEEKADDHSDTGPNPSQKVGYLDRMSVFGGRTAAPPGLPQFYNRDIFQCEIDGLPRWCSMCRIWKPDRSHHCSELGRCVYKMDHFCPWAGGIISETNFKFFIQMCIYASIYCAFILVVTAYYTAKRSQEQGIHNVNWIVISVISGLFGLFSFTIGVNSLRFACINSTTVDSLSRKSRVYQFAILIPSSSPNSTDPAAQPQAPPSQSTYTTITYPLTNPNLDRPSSTTPSRTFAILPTPQGTNPYQLSSYLENFKTVMGDHWFDWFLPIRISPCWNHDQDNTGSESGSSGTSMYKLGPVIERMKKEAGLLPLSSDSEAKTEDQNEKRQNGEG